MKTLLLLLFPTLLFAQDCITEVDKFTKDTTLSTKSIRLYGYMMSSGRIHGTIIGEDQILILSILTPTLYSVDIDQKLMLMVGDSILSLNAIRNSTGDYLGGTSWSVIVPFIISQEQIDYLIENQVSEIRLYNSKAYVESKVRKKDAIRFQDILKCIQ